MSDQTAGGTATSEATTKLATVAAAGAAVAVFMGVYGRVHDPTGETVVTAFFSGQLQLKVWFATVAALLGGFQLYTSLWMWGRVGGGARPSWLGPAHRLSGIVAFLFSLPVAYHCLWALGFAETNNRAIAHSLFGCLFYGAFVAKVLAVRNRGLPKRTLPWLGGLAFATLTLAWLTSSVWFFTSLDGRDLF